MAIKQVLGLFTDPDKAADANEALARAGYGDQDVEILTGVPYPEGTFGEKPAKHRLYVFPFIGAACGLTVAILLTAGTQTSYPLVTGGKPILSLPAMAIICYEGTMLGTILFTILGVLFESRLPQPVQGLYDPRITEGYIGMVVTADEMKLNGVEQILRGSGAADVTRGK